MIDKLLLGLTTILVLLIFLNGSGETEGRVYDCGMAEWHPDIPKAVKEECRKRAFEHWQEQQRQRKIKQNIVDT